jgi:acyl-coenzyme A thioesterase PaaI-like protein
MADVCCIANTAMHVTDLAINQMMGMQLAADGNAHLLELRKSPLLLNHVGTIHAGAQFAFAEACSGEFLLRHFGSDPSKLFAVLRTAQVKFRKPAYGELRASARFVEKSTEWLTEELASPRGALAPVQVEVTDANGIVTMSGQYEWFLRRQTDPTE